MDSRFVNSLLANSEKARKALDKFESEQSLVNFIELGWHTLEPGVDFVSNWGVHAIADHLEAVTDGSIRRLLLNVPPGCTKALPIETPVITPYGWKKHGELIPGDYVFDNDGKLQKILTTTTHNVQPCYKITFSDKVEIIAAEEHLWRVERDFSETPRARRYITVTTKELWAKNNQTNNRVDCISINSPIELPEQFQLINPYILGAWLGDGASNDGVIYCGDGDQHVLSTYGNCTLVREADNIRGTKDFYRVRIDGLRTKLRVLNLLNNKHIPDNYINGTISQRWELVRGLMDSDGHCAQDNGRCGFSNKNENITRALCQILRSLGIKVSIGTHDSKLNGINYGEEYRISFTVTAGTTVFKLNRKQSKIKFSTNARSNRRYIENVEKVEDRVVNCIGVQGGLYLAGKNFILTHNSMTTCVFFPAWEWGPKGLPHHRFISFSHERNLATRDNVRCRDLIQSEWYQENWGDQFEMKSDQNAKTYYENSETGWRQAVAAQGLTGKRGDRILCLPYTQTILTDHGYFQIGSIVEGQLNVKIRGINSKGLSWQTINKYERNPGGQIIEVITTKGSFRCTTDHLVYVLGKGWIEAIKLRNGDKVKRITDNTITYDYIEYIKEVGYENVTYNVNVADDHVYFAGGILVHNCDDPHSVKGADSDVQREEVLQIFSETVPTRLNKQAESAIIVIMQRVHERDVSGLILAKELGYEHLMLPMRFEEDRRCYSTVKPSYIEKPGLVKVFFDTKTKSWKPYAQIESYLKENEHETPKVDERYNVDIRENDGDLIDPERFPEKAVDELETALSSWGGSYAVSGQLQQRPVPRGGGMFKKSDFQILDSARDLEGKVVRGWDLAASDKKTSPYTVGVKMLLTVDGWIVVLDVNRFKKTPGAMEAELKRTVEMDGYDVIHSIPQDPGQAGKTQKAAFAKMLHGYTLHFSPESGSKLQRADPLASQAEAGNLYIVRAPWNDDYINEMCAAGKTAEYKDQLDASSRAYARLLVKKEQNLGFGPILVQQPY